MAHFYDNTYLNNINGNTNLHSLHDNTDPYNFYPTTSTTGDFDIDQSLRLTSVAEDVGVQTIDTSLKAILRMLQEPYPGPMVGLPASDLHGNGYGEHHGHPLVGWHLTCCLQIRWLRPPQP